MFSKLEVLVDFGPNPDEKILNRTLGSLRARDGVEKAEFKDGAFFVETTLPNQVVLDLVSNVSGRRTVLQGFGEGESAVAMLTGGGCGGARGVLRFQQVGETLVADGSVDALAPGLHGLHVREDGDTTQGCQSLGPHYNPRGVPHGGPGRGERHAGDLGNILADEHGRATFRIIDNVLKVSDLIGRAVSISERRDDLGQGSSPASLTDGDSGPAVACGVIARSAGVFQNPKRICLCDGVVVWDERDRPLAGKGRRGCCGGDGNKETVHGAKPCCKV